MSLLKFARMQDKNRAENLSWNRADVDRMPYRGPALPLKSKEYEAVTETVNDGRVRVFNLSVPQDLVDFQAVIDAVANGWYKILKCDHHWSNNAATGMPVCYVYCIWVERYKELSEQKAARLFV